MGERGMRNDDGDAVIATPPSPFGFVERKLDVDTSTVFWRRHP